MMLYAGDIGRKVHLSTSLRIRLSRKFVQTLEDLNIDYSIKRHNIIA